VRLSPNQRAALVALSGGEATPARLAALMTTSPEGAAQTASSLVRHQLVGRHRDRDRVVYRLTPAGLEQLRFTQSTIDSPRSAP
jgi:DNA-binding MarR family transcriptional regulator